MMKINIKKFMLILVCAIAILPFNHTIKDDGYIPELNSIVYADSIEDTAKEELAQTAGEYYSDAVRGTVTFLNYTYVVSNGQRTLAATSFGSGFFFASDLRYYYLMTNAHVVADCVQMNIWTYKGTEIKTEVVGYDEQQDVAVCRVNKLNVTDNIKILDLNLDENGDFVPLEQGDEIFCIGTPISLSFKFSLTMGIVGGIERVPLQQNDNIYLQDHAIQVDMTVNGGNSGGPVFNMDGKVVGLVTLKLSTQGQTTNPTYSLNFALPIEDMYLTAQKIRNNQSIFYTFNYNKRVAISEATTYISLRDISLKNRIKYGINSLYEGVMLVYDDSTLNLKAHSVIVGINDQKIDNVVQFRKALLKLNANETVTLKVYKSVNGVLETNVSEVQVTLITLTL